MKTSGHTEWQNWSNLSSISSSLKSLCYHYLLHIKILNSDIQSTAGVGGLTNKTNVWGGVRVYQG